MIADVVRGVILAAGASSRMGRPKAALQLNDSGETFLTRLIRTFITAGVPEIVVVTGSTAEVVRAAAGARDPRVRFVHNPKWESGQLSSLVAGLDQRGDDEPETARQENGREAVDAILMTLVDIPLVTTETCARVLEVWRTTRAPIVRPARGQVHGHPVVFDRAIFDELRVADPTIGAKTVVRAHAAEIVNVPIDDPGAFLDIDTEADYRAILKP